MTRSLPLGALAALFVLGACSSQQSGSSGGTSSTTGGTTSGTGGAAPMEVRGERYCEILLATAAPPNVHIEVWNTFGLNDCPDALWSKVDPKAVAQAEGVTMAVLNGPRYWTLDEFVVASLLDPATKTLGGLEMRHAGNLDLPAADAGSMQAPYTLHTVERHTTFRFLAGRPVFELVDPEGKVYDMQSFSVQKVPQTESSLADLGATLKPPQGWLFRTRTLTEDLDVTAVDDQATVVTDENANTYQLSQQ
ncbi:MAG: hypothetical protein U0359_05835 [Byssovorax sp.]